MLKFDGGYEIMCNPKVGFAKSLKNGDPRGGRTLVTGVRDQKHLTIISLVESRVFH